jgi:spore maturation protein CgeB
MAGIPTIRVFEALACGIPLISAPWEDSERLFREGDLLFVRNGEEMKRGMEKLLSDKSAAKAQALYGLETVLSRHTCRHRAEELSSICEEVLH